MNNMLKENNSNPSANFIESELNYYKFLLPYVDMLIVHSKDIYYLQLNTEAYVTKLIISLSLIENIHLHLITRQLLLQKTSLHIPTDDYLYLRDKYEQKIQQLKELLSLSPETQKSNRNNMNTSDMTFAFPDYSFHDSIKGIYNDVLVTYNPWK